LKARTHRLVLTLGEPAGIGPDIAILAAQQRFNTEIVVVGSPQLMHDRAKLMGLPLVLTDFDPLKKPQANGNNTLSIIPVNLKAPCIPGTLNPDNSAYVLETLKVAVEQCLDKNCQAMVTGPVHKGIIAESGYAFTGHTEFLAQCSQSKAVLMSFNTPEVIVGLATTHLPLQAVTSQLTYEKLTTALWLFYQGLRNIYQHLTPKVLVCGLNPHAGEGGLLGYEEQEMIIPVIENLKSQGLDLTGPNAGDTAFSPENRQHYDGIFAMYHDQGLSPIKALYFGDIVNVTMGLPFLRTSVDHGTALNLVGKNPSANSLRRAIQLAEQYGGRFEF
jgi:4-hydroxythreonine-4-phosphate dehydrogenase